MLARLGRFLGFVLYLIGWGLAVLVIAQAIILSIATGNLLLPVLLGFIGVAIWVIGIAFRRMLAERN
jgi:steroid 5-alpha reductase family enzyme